MYGHLVLLFPLLCSTAAALQMTGPSTYTASVGSIAHIPCTFTADKLPADLKFFAVVWYLEEKRILRYDNTVTSTHPRYSLEEDRALNGNAALTISNTSVSDGGDYTCSVIYSPLQMEKKIRVDITAIPTITMVNKVVTVSTKSSLNSTISGFYPARIDIKWLRDGVILYNVAVEELQRDPDGTYSVNSSVTITPTEEDRERIFSCRIQHESLTAPLQEDFRLVYSARPLVSILGNSVQRKIENTLTCMVSGFFPSDIVVTWYKDGEVLKDPLMGETRKNDNGTFQVNSTVTIKPSDDDQNKTFSCRVQHISLQEPLQEDFQLSYQEPSSLLVIIGIVVLVVVVIIAAGITGIILWKRKCRRKGTVEEEERDGRRKDRDNDKSNGDKDEAEKLLSPNKGRLPDPEVGEITVPDLIAEKRAELSCKIYNYILGEHECSWYVKEKSSGDVIPPDKSKHQSTERDETSDDQNTFIAYLALSPVEQSDDGSEFIFELKFSDRVIERSTGPVHVKGVGENPSDTKNTQHTPIKPSRCTEESGSKSPESPKQPLLPKEKDGQRWEPPFVKQTPKQPEDESNRTVTPAKQSASLKENPKAPENRQLPDLEVGEITVPDLIAGKRAKLSCKLYNYSLGKYKCSWYVKLNTTGKITHANYDGKKHQSEEKDKKTYNQNTYIAYLALVPVEESDDGSEFNLKVELPDRVIERSTGPVHVKGNPRHFLSPDKRKNELNVSIEEGKDQSTESPSAENRKPQSSDQQQICKPVHEEQPQCPVTVEEEDNNDIIIAMKSYSSNPEPGDKEECIHLDNMEAEDPIKISPHSPYAEENPEGSSLRSDKDHKEDQFPKGQKHEKEENTGTALPINISSKPEGGDQEESANLDNMDAKDLAQKSELSMKIEKEHKGDQSPASKSYTQEKDTNTAFQSSSSSSTSLTDEEEL